ncbi:MAG TPA: glycosyltransferase [Bacteroidia bacterium]|nr:glycosyltransferase [Bacteroidia bacterium]
MAFALVTIYQCCVYLFLYGKIAFYKETATHTQEFPPVSVIICAKNEADNLVEYLPRILSQEYPEFEVIVVNDCSWDNTEDVLREYSKIFTNLKTILIKEDDYYKHGKKFALMVGIKGAKHENLLFTDGDCYPNSNTWIKEMMQGYTAGKEIIIGYGPYIKERSFLNRLIRFDAFTIGLHYLSFGLINKPYMGVGRNLSYKKELFFKNKGFATHYHINSGDDDLFVNQAANANNTGVVISQESFTYSVPAKTFADWGRQKARHLSTSGLYTSGSKNRLLMIHAANYLFWMLAVAAFCLPSWILVTASLFLLKNIIQLVTFYKSGQKLDEKDLIGGFLLFEFLLLFLYPVWHFKKVFVKTAKWKS